MLFFKNANNFSSSLIINKELKTIYREFKNEYLHQLKCKSKLERELMFIEHLKKSDVISKDKLEYYHLVMKSYEINSKNIYSTFINLFIPFILNITFFMISLVLTTSILFGEKSFDIKELNNKNTEQEKLNFLAEVIETINENIFQILENFTFQIIFYLIGIMFVLWSINQFHITRIPFNRMIETALNHYPKD
jgi:bisphosphoglycerate-dependent phosphoglycerate mutase